MKLKMQDLLDQKELIQEDLTCLLFLDENVVLTNACQIIVDRFQVLISKFKEIEDDS